MALATVDKSEPKTAATRRSAGRGSLLLLVGRGGSLVLNLVAQVLTVRFFSKLDYGAFAFVLSIVSVAATVLVLGMDKTLGRYAAIYHERRDLPKLFGSIGFALALVASLGCICVGGVGLASFILELPLLGDRISSGLLLILVILAPLNALDSVVVALFGVFANPRAIVLRRHLVGPLLKLTAIATVILMSGNVYWLAAAHAIAVGMGTLLGAILLVQLMRRDSSLQTGGKVRWEYPARELLGHSLPLMSTDVVMMLRTSLVVVLLEFISGTVAVAEYRAVSPLARLNEVVVTTLAVLFIPAASRVFAQRDAEQLNALYWRTASSLAVLSFPLFAATFVLAEPLTTLLLGAQYNSSAPVLAILAFACYIHTSLGFNSQTLRVYGRVRAVVTTDILASLFAIVGYYLLIPAYGPLGAAYATAGGLLLQNLLNQFWLVRTTDVRLFDAGYVGTLFTVALAAILLIAAQYFLAPHIVCSLALAALASLGLLLWNRDVLDVDQLGPAARRIPWLGQRLNSTVTRTCTK